MHLLLLLLWLQRFTHLTVFFLLVLFIFVLFYYGIFIIILLFALYSCFWFYIFFCSSYMIIYSEFIVRNCYCCGDLYVLVDGVCYLMYFHISTINVKFIFIGNSREQSLYYCFFLLMMLLLLFLHGVKYNEKLSSSHLIHVYI